MKKLAIVGLVSAALFGAATYSIAVQRDSDSALLREARKYFQPLPKQIPVPSDNPTTKKK